ncbi:MAG: GTPase domain-containing protein [Candidatus Cloacimonetes bacterium]|jgi:hypothetical protein|nr:GTPase domain-containing protein [Candidatus Cloacimonadota bacterium]MDD2506185.1 GTPase domain-containing protein [Candidatus Cloacimonadota bacterium]MDD4147473.1 GTPase domain-containing protein [Candidatus Cloacimonadota bacterium]MDD4559355.1 GTPase domain-containing protein [Candidatus Cloacimonadota bacterium]
MKKLISTGVIKNIALVGISKNAGKTSLLNSLLKEFPLPDRAVMSTGIDGESEDRVFKTPKPQVHLFKGDIFCCDANTVTQHGSSVSLLHSSQYAGRKLYLARAEESLATQITGPSALSHQRVMIDTMHQLGAHKVFIDGSLDRKSIALDDSIDALILAIGASFGSTEQIVTEIRRLCILRDIPTAELSVSCYNRLKESDALMILRKAQWQSTGIKSLIGNEKKVLELLEQEPRALYVPTSFTDSLYEKLGRTLSKPGFEMILRHPECLKLNIANLRGLMKHTQTKCLISFKLAAFALNSTAIGSDPISADLFREDIRTAFPREQFYDIMEI